MSFQGQLDECYSTTFVGRAACLKLLEKTSERYRLIELVGLRAVGKSRTIREFFKRKHQWLQHSGALSAFNDSVEICIDMRFIADVQSFHTNICASLGVEPELSLETYGNSKHWIKQVCQSISSNYETLHLILFDNAEEIIECSLRNDFLCLCDSMMKQENTIIYITSTTQILTADLNSVYSSCELKPMPPHEARGLLELACPNVDLGAYKDSIVKLCEGIPLILLMVGSELTADEGLIQPEDMVELLTCCRLQALSRDEYSEADRIADVYQKFLNRLPKKYQRRLAAISYIPGTFTASEAASLFGEKSYGVSQCQLLRYYTRRSMIKRDSSSGRFDIQGILRECLEVYYSVYNLPEIRRRFCQVFTVVMVNICKRLGTEECVKALSQFSQEQPNLQKLLTEVYQTSDDIYPFFIKISEQCYELINRFMYNQSELFYNGCLKVASNNHQVGDMVTVYLAIGHLYSDVKGEFTEAEEIYQRATKLLNNHHHSTQMAQLCQRIGSNFHNRGLFAKSIPHLLEALNIHKSLKTDYTAPALQVIFSLAVAYACTGRFKEAEKLHLECLNRKEQVYGKYHQEMGVTKNGLGLMYDLMGDSDRALKFYLDGFEIKKKNSAPLWTVVYSMSNIANIYRSMKKFSEAIEVLEEALERLRKENTPHKGALSLTYDTMGKTFLSQDEYETALDFFEKAVEIRKQICPNGVTHVESLMHLALAQKGLGMYNCANKIFHQVLKLKDETISSMPNNPFITECLEGLVGIYRQTGQRQLERTTLETLHSELLRLERVCSGQGNSRRIGFESVHEKIQNIQKLLDS